MRAGPYRHNVSFKQRVAIYTLRPTPRGSDSTYIAAQWPSIDWKPTKNSPSKPIRACLLPGWTVVDILFSCLVDLVRREQDSCFDFGCPAGTDSKRESSSTRIVR